MKRWLLAAPFVLAAALLLVVLPVLGANLAPNYGFESGSGSDADGWTEGTQHIRTSERAHMGTYSLKSEYLEASTYSIVESSVPVTAGTWYVSYWGWRDSADGTAWLQIDYYYGADPVLTMTTDTGAWQFVSYTWTVETDDSVTIRLHTDGITAGVYFDDLCLSATELDCAEETPTPSTTLTPTQSHTPSNTATSTATPTASKTPTSTATVETATPSSTPTLTPTKTPLTGFAWAPGLVEVDSDMLDDIEDLITIDPPEGSTGSVYAVTDAGAYDDGWLISLVNVVGIEAPYTGWSLADNAAWAGAVYCEGVDPDYTCSYFTFDVGGSSESAFLPFPWKPGTRAQYGVAGVHSGISYIPDSYGVDFFGSDLWDTSNMPAEAYAVETGTVSYVCRGSVNLGVKVSGAHEFYYLHMQPDTNLNNGDAISRGERLGLLVRGTFDDPPCGYASQGADKYHLHFAFQASNGYLTMGGCNLNVSSGLWVCGTDSYGPLSFLSTNPLGPIPDDDDYTPALGGEHIWDGIVAMIVESSKAAADSLFPDTADTSAISQLSTWSKQSILVGLVMMEVTHEYLGGTAGGMIGLLAFLIINLEIAMMTIRLFMFIVRILGKIKGFF